ncbi:MAG TPA: sugar phosphate isomerase/epimerase [Terriglobales bacterium]|jgi:sugar phosphate isomerase/epimerase|nr:sugar phosphate isomerase/epimerase [Terriglobales bacterium]
MSPISRRTFLQATSAAVAAGALGNSLAVFATPLGLPLGLQLYSVRDQIKDDFEGTLKQVGAVGYREVESAGYYGKSADEFKKALTLASLRCVSAHYSLSALQTGLDDAIKFSKALGVKFIICSSPALKDPAKTKDFGKVADAMTMDDWKWDFEQFNKIGKQTKKEGIQFGYHNHTMEFKEENGMVPFDEMMKLTDPADVVAEMDCGWVAVAGASPVDYLKKYPTRIAMLHIKDFKLNGSHSVNNPPPCTELGRGSIDYKPIFEAAKAAKIAHYFVEQEEFTMPPFESLKVDADYIKGL